VDCWRRRLDGAEPLFSIPKGNWKCKRISTLGPKRQVSKETCRFSFCESYREIWDFEGVDTRLIRGWYLLLRQAAQLCSIMWRALT